MEEKQNEREEEKKRKQKSRDELEEDLYRRIGLRRVGGEGRGEEIAQHVTTKHNITQDKTPQMIWKNIN